MHRVVLICLLLFCIGCQTSGSAKHSVTKISAANDGKSLVTAEFQKALDDAAKAGGGEIVVPPGNYLIGSIVMGSNTTLRLEKGATLTGSPNKEDYPLMTVRWEGRWRDGHRALIHAKDAKNIAIVGEGTINGDMRIGELRNPRGPSIFEPIECQGVKIDGIRINFRRMWTIHLTYCSDVIARNLTIRSVRDNGDGIDVDSTKDVLIENCDINTGDDAIALKSGRGMEAVRIARPTENVTIKNCKLGSAFAGLAFGTEMSGGIRNVKFSDCTFTRGSNGIFIKSRVGRGGFMENITGENLKVEGARAFLRFDLVSRGIQDSEPVQGDDAYPRVGNIKLSNITGTCDVLVEGNSINPERPVDGLTIVNTNVTAKRGIKLSNVKNAVLRDIKVEGAEGDLISTTNVTGPDGKPVGTPAPASAPTTVPGR